MEFRILLKHAENRICTRVKKIFNYYFGMFIEIKDVVLNLSQNAGTTFYSILRCISNP